MTGFHEHLPGVLMAWAAFVLATVSPGPALLATLGTSMASGRRAGLLLGLGIVAGSCSWAVLTAAGLSALLAGMPGALELIRAGGGLYLAWLAAKALRSAAAPAALAAGAAAPGRGGAGWFLKGWAIQIANPKAILAWIAIISLGLKPGAPGWVAPLIIAGTSSFGVLFYCLAAAAFSSPAVLAAYGRARRWIDAALGAFFAAAAVKLLAS
ncbi:MAG TPA: LysE family transporter [Azospirillaceae bacterium]|nr:LysE family transporter [Azospirillaceae bacterium]